MAKPKKKRVPEPRSRTVDAFDFVSVCLAAGSGHLTLDAFVEYLATRRPAERKRRRRK